MRLFYNLLIYALQLPVAVYWLVRGLINSSYRDRFGQRFGIGYPWIGRCIWIHAVSVGEVQAAVPLVRAIEKRFPDIEMLITTVTPTGAARVRSAFGDTVKHCYIPLEMPIAVDRFYESVNPELALIMETEIWPNLYRGCGVRDIPLVLVSAESHPSPWTVTTDSCPCSGTRSRTASSSPRRARPTVRGSGPWARARSGRG